MRRLGCDVGMDDIKLKIRVVFNVVFRGKESDVFSGNRFFLEPCS